MTENMRKNVKMKDKYIDQYGIDSLPNLKQASDVGAEYFTTTNQGLIDDREELEEVFKIKIRTPQEMVENELK